MEKRKQKGIPGQIPDFGEFLAGAGLRKSQPHEEFPMRIESVELVALPGAPSWQEKVYRAHLDNGEDMDLFQQHWDVPLPPESLVGLTVEEARKRRNERMFAVASGHH